jgi:hypothetical protein
VIEPSPTVSCVAKTESFKGQIILARRRDPGRELRDQLIKDALGGRTSL